MEMEHTSDTKVIIIVKNQPRLLANATVVIPTAYGMITIKGFQVWKSNHFNERLTDKINIAPPTKPAYGKFHQIVFIENINSWYELEELIYSAFKNEFTKKGIRLNEDINPDEIHI